MFQAIEPQKWRNQNGTTGWQPQYEDGHTTYGLYITARTMGHELQDWLNQKMVNDEEPKLYYFKRRARKRAERRIRYWKTNTWSKAK